MWRHHFLKYPLQNSDTVAVPEYKVQTLYPGTWESEHEIQDNIDPRIQEYFLITSYNITSDFIEVK